MVFIIRGESTYNTDCLFSNKIHRAVFEKPKNVFSSVFLLLKNCLSRSKVVKLQLMHKVLADLKISTVGHLAIFLSLTLYAAGWLRVGRDVRISLSNISLSSSPLLQRFPPVKPF